MPRLMVRDGSRSVVRDIDRHVPLDRICAAPIPYATGWAVQPDGAALAVLDRDGARRETIRPGGELALGSVTLAVSASAIGATTDRIPLEPRARLALRLPDGELVMLGAETITLGKASVCDIVLRDPTVSDRHCMVVPRRDGWEVRDAGSTNGTRVGGVRIEAAMLTPAVVLLLGRCKITCVDAADGAGERVDGGASEALVGESHGMRAVRAEIDRFAPNPYPVLVHGETGSGKEIVARMLHDRSTRARGPFVAVNAGAIPPELVESELFGHERGAFTGAATRRRGVFEEASGGSLFLDELGELPTAQQAKLLRVLETREIRRVGAEGNVRVDVRVIGATHRDLGSMAEAGLFRRDLLYRLEVLRIRLPALRERREDIPMLTRHLLGRVAIETKHAKTIDDAAMRRLVAYDWPGNVRELLGVLRRASVSDESPVISAAQIELPATRERPTLRPENPLPDVAPSPTRDVSAVELQGMLAACDGNLSRLSRVTGLARSTLRARLRLGET